VSANPTGPRARRDRVRRDVAHRLGADDLHLFGEGRYYRLYEKLGAHPASVGRAQGVSFAVWAPNARAVSVVGSFNDWSAGRNPLRAVGRSGIWAGFVADVAIGALYKYHVESHEHGVADKTDPLAFRRQVAPDTASIVWTLDYAWGDADWMARRAERRVASEPLSIYELHLGSWRRPADDPSRLPTYAEIGDELIPYLEATGFTHVEFLPVLEHPYYASWGYQATGYFAATSRYGTPQELMRLIDRLHQHGFGVILDWVPSHFPTDEHGLVFFDGTHLYEYADPRLGYQRDWRSYVFDYGRAEVRGFLVSSALFWLDRYHIDGLRVDGVASMLYRDYSRPEGEWLPNEHGGKENLEAIGFLRQLNEAVHQHHPGTFTIAEESTAWPMVSRPAYVGGLGFDMKWDMGWMHDTLRYLGYDPVFRKFHHGTLTFRMMYGFSENFVLALSHDEVVHGKRSLLDKLHGDAWQKRATLRALYAYMWALPGKKLLFMGGEIGAWREWDHDSALDWSLLEHPGHVGLLRWVGELNRLYRELPALHATDFDGAGFRWIDCSDAEQSVLCFLRQPARAAPGPRWPGIVVVLNLTPVPRHNYRIGLPAAGTWHERLNSDGVAYGGSGLGNRGPVRSVPIAYQGEAQSVTLTLPALSAVFLEHTEAPGAFRA